MSLYSLFNNFLKRKNHIFLFSILISILISIFLEVFFFNVKNILKPQIKFDVENVEFVNFKKTREGDIVGLQDYAQIILNFKESYLKNLKYKINIVEDKSENLGYEVFINGKDRLNIKTDYFNRQFGLENKTITINETTETIIFKFHDVKGSSINISNLTINNYFQFNFIRFLFIFVFLSFFINIFLLNFLDFSTDFFAPLVVVVFGVMLSIFIPPHHTWDEYSHFIKSYSVANLVLFPTNKTKFEYPIGIEKVDLTSNLEYNSYEDFLELKSNLDSVKKSNSETKQIESTAIINLFIPYIPSGIGMRIAMTFNLPIYFYLWFGRIMNVLFYSFLFFLALKYTPFGKRIICFYGMLPINVFLAASLSCDFMAMGCLLLALSLTMNIVAKSKKISFRVFFALIVLYSCITFAKVSYAPFFFLIFLFRSKSFSSKKQRDFFRIIAISACGLVAIGTYAYASKLGIVQWSREGVDSSLQMMGIIKEPLKYVLMLFEFISNNSVNYVVNMFSFFAYVGNVSQIYVLIIVFTLLFFSFFDISEHSKQIDHFGGFDNYSKLVIGISSLGGLFLSLTALYISFTAVGAQQVDGFQGRYMLPIVFPLLLIFRNKKTGSPYSITFLERLLFLIVFVLFIPLFYNLFVSFYNS